jgi:hypothetical protein
VRYSLSFWSLGLGTSLAGTLAGLDSSHKGQVRTGFRMGPGAMEGGGGAQRPRGLDLLRDVAEGVGL